MKTINHIRAGAQVKKDQRRRMEFQEKQRLLSKSDIEKGQLKKLIGKLIK